ncbi:hypothetical protein NFJ02_05g120900 [Pycnococcus provasolii]
MDDFAMFQDVLRKLTKAGAEVVWHTKHARIREEGLTAKLMASWDVLNYGHDWLMELNMPHNKRMDVLIYDFVVVEAKKARRISTLRGTLEKDHGVSPEHIPSETIFGVSWDHLLDHETVGHVAARLVRKLDGWRGRLPRVIDPLSESQWRAALERHSQHANAMETWLFGIQG